MAALVEAKRLSCSDENSCTIKATHFEQALNKISPSVSHKVWSIFLIPVVY